MKKRLFVSISLPDDLQDHFAGVMERVRVPGVKWTMHENLHITLHFIGYVEEDLVGAIEGKIEKVVRGARSVNLKFEEAEIAPPNGIPKMVWATFEDIGGGYKKLEMNLAEALREFGGGDTKKPIPHVTLARFDVPSIARSIDLKKFDYTESAEFTASRIEFMESRLSSLGPTYTVIHSYTT